MIQTSTRAEKRRLARERSYAAATPLYNQTNPLGNRLTRRGQAKQDRTIIETLRKFSINKHILNLKKAKLEGYKFRMNQISKRKLK